MTKGRVWIGLPGCQSGFTWDESLLRNCRVSPMTKKPALTVSRSVVVLNPQTGDGAETPVWSWAMMRQK